MARKPSKPVIPSDIRTLARMARIVRDLSPEHLEAWITCGRRIVAGMPVAEAEGLMWRELASAGGGVRSSS